MSNNGHGKVAKMIIHSQRDQLTYCKMALPEVDLQCANVPAQLESSKSVLNRDTLSLATVSDGDKLRVMEFKLHGLYIGENGHLIALTIPDAQVKTRQFELRVPKKEEGGE